MVWSNDIYIFQKMDNLNNQILELQAALDRTKAENTYYKLRNAMLANDLQAKTEACRNLTIRIEEEVKKRQNMHTAR